MRGERLSKHVKPPQPRWYPPYDDHTVTEHRVFGAAIKSADGFGGWYVNGVPVFVEQAEGRWFRRVWGRRG